MNAGAQSFLCRLEEALQLISLYDPIRYKRLIRDLDRVWVMRLAGTSARFEPKLYACILDQVFLSADSSTREIIAAAIVHEATHARLWRAGIRYDQAIRRRVETACVRRELAFAGKLPNGQGVRERAEWKLKVCADDEYWTDQVKTQRFVEAHVNALRELGLPNWLIRVALGVRAFRGYLHRRRGPRPI
jgi:hypothetical protein